jgi:crossover junction endodeoxyribonuclease RuvC
MSVWGIDVGLNGAIALFDMIEGHLEVHDMPVMEINKKRQVNPQLLTNILEQHEAPVFIEQVGARPGQGVSSMFNFGKSFGICLGVSAGLKLQTTTVSPVAWQRACKVEKGKDGNRLRATQTFPNYSNLFARKKDDGRADAALIAYWGAVFFE